MQNENLMNNCEKVLQRLSRLPLDQFEVYGLSTKELSVEMEKNSIRDFTDLLDTGIGIRIIRVKRIGFAYSTSFKDRDLEDLINRVLKFTKVGKPDQDFQKLADPGKYQKVKNLFDPNLKDIEANKAIDTLDRISNAANIDKYIYSVSAGFTASNFHEIILNSNDIELEEEYSLLNLNCNVTSKDGSKKGSSFDFQSIKFIKEMTPEKIGQNAAELALKSLNSRQLKTGELSVIFHPIALSTILAAGIGHAINAEAIQYQQSYLTDKLGDKLFDTDINIEDNGLFIKNNGIPAVGTSNFDAEGNPTKKTTIFKDGILRNFIHNSYTANKENISSTGNAIRNSYRSTPSISISNLIFEKGNDGELSDLISSTERGIILYYTGDTPNVVTGDLSAMIHTGFQIEDGEITNATKNNMIGVNMLDLFNNIEMIGSKLEDIGRIHIPPISVSNIRVSGS
jgi:PmbA protein